LSLCRLSPARLGEFKHTVPKPEAFAGLDRIPLAHSGPDRYQEVGKASVIVGNGVSRDAAAFFGTHLLLNEPAVRGRSKAQRHLDRIGHRKSLHTSRLRSTIFTNSST
jgi:hypothetical protein